jgi:predicted translin family RNA/ssDNA-binding protein
MHRLAAPRITAKCRILRIGTLYRTKPVAFCLLRAAFSTTAAAMSMLPKPPLKYHHEGKESFTLDLMGEELHQIEKVRQDAYELSRSLHVALQIRKNDPTRNEGVQACMNQLVNLNSNSSNNNSRTPRLANLSQRVEDYIRQEAFQHFLQTGALLAQSQTLVKVTVTDEEYLAGACMGLAQDLLRYGLGRATARDVESVQLACDLVRAILEYLLGLDFRNGPLRRKYDGTKYALKGLESLLYELAVTSASSAEIQTLKPAEDGTTERILLPMDELKALQARMEHRDELRESIIKQCRDGQKAAKQSIFALHRGDLTKASTLLRECETLIVEQLLPIVEDEPPLRQGSFADLVEEYVEAKLFATWLYGEDLQNPTSSPGAVLLKPIDFAHVIALDHEEYLGGLCDLTGEVGRYAVQRGTARDTDGVKLCLHTNSDIRAALELLERLPGGVAKKMDALRQSVEKLERMLYEMSLSEAAGGRNVTSEVDAGQSEDIID